MSSMAIGCIAMGKGLALVDAQSGAASKSDSNGLNWL
jgi:hypothetical protein